MLRFMSTLFMGFLITASVGRCTQCQKQTTDAQPKTEQGQPQGAQAPAVQTSVSELKIEDLTPGTGAEAASGKKVKVHYIGTLTDGTKFDSSRDRGEPFAFVLGAGQVIPGWDKGVQGMKTGGKRRLTVPSSMAYGDRGVPGVIPGGATLVFEVELLGVE